MALPRVDAVLEMCLNLVSDETGTGSIGLTITIGGVVVSGLAITEQEYFRLLGDQLGQAFARIAGEQLGTTMRDQLTEFGRRAYEERQKAKAQLDELASTLPEGEKLPAEQVEATRRRYIHFKDARIFNGNHIHLPLWRGRLADVTGWAGGSYLQDQP